MHWDAKLRILMEARNEKRVSLAKAIGVSSATITYWLSGECTPRLREMIKLAKYYGLTLDQLFMDDVPLPAILEIRLPVAKESPSRKKGQTDARKALRKPRKK